mmetsp:Transcript_26550/g.62319  ORF Transcript_26550/g.62319 Transcript_26550/m.62319 type:complete len:186 (-) Transcript_26550:181-738(-)
MAAKTDDVKLDVQVSGDKGPGCYEKWALTTFGASIDNNKGATFNLFFAHVIFWAFGFPAGLDHGYDDASKHEDGQIPSGPSGSGIFIITLVLVSLATIIFLVRAGRIWINGRPETTEEIIRRKTTRRRDSTSEMQELERKSSAHDVMKAKAETNPYATPKDDVEAGAAAAGPTEEAPAADKGEAS